MRDQGIDLHELGLLQDVFALLVLLTLLKSPLLQCKVWLRPCTDPCEEARAVAEAGAHIFPAEHSTAAGAVDVCNSVEASHEQALFLWPQGDVYPAGMTPCSVSFTVLTSVNCRYN